MVDRFEMCRDIYERIDKLLTADAVIVAPGGMGTVQELAGFALMKEHALAHPDAPESKAFKGKELVLLNSEISINGKKRGFYDELVNIIPQEQLGKLGIHIVNTVDQAMQIMRDLKQKKLSESGHSHSSKAAEASGRADIIHGY